MAYRKAIALLLLVAVMPLSALTRRWERWEGNWQGDAALTNVRGGTGFQLFYPWLQDSHGLYFSQTGVGWYRDNYFLALGVGGRRFVSNGLALGANAFADVAISAHDNSFVQGGFGLEALGRCWEARLNGYFPGIRGVTIKEEVLPGAVALPNPEGPGELVFSNDSLIRRVERSYWGFDGDVGAFIPVGPGELWGRVGYCYFETDTAKAIHGPLVQAEYVVNPLVGWGAQLYFGIFWHYDNVSRGQTGANVGFRVPFCWWSKTKVWTLSSLCRRMAYAVRRQHGVMLRKRPTSEPLPSEFIRNLFFVQGGNGVATATQEDPTGINDLMTTKAVTANDILFFLNSAGSIDANNAPGTTIQLLSGQVAAGFGSGVDQAIIPVGGGRNLVIDALAGQSGRPTITHSAAGDAFTLAATPGVNRLQGLGFITLDNGIVNDPASEGAIMLDLSFSGVTTAGLALTNPVGIYTLANSTFGSSPGAIGVSYVQNTDNRTATLFVENTTFDGAASAVQAGDTGFGNATTLGIQNNAITNTTGVGVDIALSPANTTLVNLLNATISNNTFDTSAGEAILLDLTVPGVVATPDRFVALIQGNTFEAIAGSALLAGHIGPGQMDLSVLSNSDAGGMAAVAAYDVARLGADAPGILCTNLNGNNSDRTTGIALTADPALMEVELLPTLSSRNSNVATAITGFPADVPADTCELPPQIPAPLQQP